ncbi:MAG: hypothetical protein OK457_01780 [Thaumarchaeota archaeon]|nr:hypothetical protein [Nitrososphaerota archaeon]
MSQSLIATEEIGSGILDGISKGLDSIGANVEEVFYTEMMLSHNLSKNEILDRPEEFTEAMSKFFRIGTSLVDRAIGKEIVKNFGIPVRPGINFKTAMEIVMKLPAATPKKKEFSQGYDPTLCKTCQKLGRADATTARELYSDCQEHFRQRVLRLKKYVRMEGNLKVHPMFNST